MDLYQILEIKPNASESEIKKAYHKLAKQYHPDKNCSSDANIKFQKIQSSYEILINDKTRYEYQKMNNNDKFNFVDILEKIIQNKININEFNKLDEKDIKYIKQNFMNFFNSINVSELLNLFNNGYLNKKDTSINCSESDVELYDETLCEYHHTLPISIQKVNNLDIKLELSIKLSDIDNNKRKIKIKRNIDDELETSTFKFNLSHPYVVFIGAGDSNNDEYGNLIIKLNLPKNLYWTENLILIEQSMSLYELIYGLDIHLDFGENKIINIENWVPSRDGNLIDINNKLSNFKIKNYNLAIKLFLDYETNNEKENILKKYFS
jgi:curved DNA-binding protein CbpA